VTEEDRHPTAELDDTVHQRARLGILTILDESHRADFAYLKRVLGLTDGNLGRHLEVLSGQDLVALEKVFEGRRPRTWVTITPAGRAALAAEIASLRALVRRFDASR
jgi:DNA-binding MarR family transcriptional regulator